MFDTKSLVINLPSTSIDASTAFLEALGVPLKEEWSGSETSKSFEFIPNVIIVYHTHGQYKQWLPKDFGLADTKTTNAVIITLSVESKEVVDKVIEKAVQAGGTRGPNMLEGHEEMCGMYSRSVLDPDGHLYEIVAASK